MFSLVTWLQTHLCFAVLNKRFLQAFSIFWMSLLCCLCTYFHQKRRSLLTFTWSSPKISINAMECLPLLFRHISVIKVLFFKLEILKLCIGTVSNILRCYFLAFIILYTCLLPFYIWICCLIFGSKGTIERNVKGSNKIHLH